MGPSAPHIFHSFIAQYRPPDPSRHNFCAIWIFPILRSVRGDGLLQTWGVPKVVIFGKVEATCRGWSPLVALDPGAGGMGLVSMFAAVCKNITEGFYPMLRTSDSGPEVCLPGRISAGLWSFKIGPPAGHGCPESYF